MGYYPFALLIDNHSRTFDRLKDALRHLGIETYSVQGGKDAEALIAQCRPGLVFADSSLPDGAWLRILSVAEEAEVPLNVIVVAAFPDTRRYLNVLEKGAFDFIVPPFEYAALQFVLRSAQLDVRRRREAITRAAVEVHTPHFAGWAERAFPARIR